MKLSEQEIQVRKEIVLTAQKVAETHERILSTIHKAPSEKKQLQGLKKLHQTLEVVERQIYLSIGKLN